MRAVYILLLPTFIGLFIATAYAQAPNPQEYLMLSAPPAIMLEIARCESGTQQFKTNGSLVRDSVTGDHIGLFQISLKLHEAQAKKMGWDISTPQGNIAEALWLYKKYGTSPWNASKTCWSGNSG